jgi:hypothetical protein
MILRALKSGQPSVLFFIPFLAVLLWLKYLIYPHSTVLTFEPVPMPFYAWLSGLLEGRPVLSKLVSLSLLIFSALWLARLNTKFILLPQRTYLPGILFIILVSSYQPLQTLHPVLFVTALLLVSIEIMLEAQRRVGLALEFFMASFLIAIAGLFYARSALLMLLVWTGLALFRPLNWREWVFTILGFATPVVFLFSWYYLSGQDMAEKWELIRMNFIHDRDPDYLNVSYYLFYGFISLLIVLASRKMISQYQKMKIYLRLFFRFNFWVFVFVLISFALIYSRAIEMIYFLAIPTSYILSYYLFTSRSKLRTEIMFFLVIAGYVFLVIRN